jgi:DNA-binding MarR family transcriptional regulator
VGELATELGVTPGWASRLADELVLAGHAVREQDPADRRVVRLRISPAMEARCAQIYCERSAAVARALEGASPEDLATFTRLIGRIAAEFETLAAPHRVDSSIGATMDPSSPPIASGDIRAARSSV